ncbi:hypothetical protein BK129_14825 [Paenibacillus amylolyticus]|jgi:hypothetical protein|uniref:hypothetical protein n=1 Tax=Paenibacillus amylolyticus TaxID=1451 RepID=UPI00096F5BCC|nr:hypothetical protein [Paenibacillus amylolyticus]OMF05258.1 hypothetical protein BK129_14825 [Paenibacillus amylolyticus]
MGVKRYEKRIPVDAIQFEGMDPNHINEVIAFVNFPVMMDFTGGINLRIIKSQLDVLVVPIGDYIVKDATGKQLIHMKQAAFEAEYTLVSG